MVVVAAAAVVVVGSGANNQLGYAGVGVLSLSLCHFLF